jgi:N-acetylmuramoyl-L-alanine amidase
MWRWVTRGLVLTCASLIAAVALAQSQPTGFVGGVDLPDPTVVQSGVVFVKGYAYDIQQLTRIELYVDDAFQYNVNLGLPRIDVVEQYTPQYPGIQNAAPGFQIGFLASRYSDGPHTISLKAYTTDGQSIEFGRRTVNIDNTLNQSPFGFLDIPDPAGIYNATSAFPVVGWATDTDGISEVDVYVDGLILQSAIYGDPRPDVGNTFPDFPASIFSGFVANIDTTRILDGVHLLDVRATDTKGVSRLIGRRQIQVFNSEAEDKPFGYIDEPKRDAVLYGTFCGQVPASPVSPPINPNSHVTPVRGWALDLAPRTEVGRVSYVELLIDGVEWASTNDCGFNTLFNQYANCYGLPRFDVERYYPNYPDAPRSGYMFTLDIGALVGFGVNPGNHVLKVRVGDRQGTFTELPNPDGIPVFFECVTDLNDFPSVGFIDAPVNYDYIKGNAVFQGWAVDENGGVAAVTMFIDGNNVGNAQIGLPRPDVAQQDPQFFAQGANSGWKFVMDTTRLSNARHRLTVEVTDGRGHQTIIGSVDFYTQNP